MLQRVDVNSPGLTVGDVDVEGAKECVRGTNYLNDSRGVDYSQIKRSKLVGSRGTKE
jgi:hypothetical protein